MKRTLFIVTVACLSLLDASVAASATSPCRVYPAGGASSIMAAIAACPDGTAASPTIIQFPVNGRYRTTGRILVANRRYITINGNGSTFTTTANGGNSRGVNGNWVLLRDSGLTLENMTAVGSFTLSDPRSLGLESQQAAYSEADMNYGIYGGDHIVLVSLTGQSPWGDGVETADANYVDGGSDSYPSFVTISKSRFTHTSRHCGSFTSGTNLTFDGNTCSDDWYNGFDAEIDGVSQPLTGVTISNNSFNGFSDGGITVPAAGNANTQNITISGNNFNSAADNICDQVILVGGYPTVPSTFSNVRTDGNTIPYYGEAISYDHVIGGEIANNTLQPRFTGANPCGSANPIGLTNSSNVSFTTGSLTSATGTTVTSAPSTTATSISTTTATSTTSASTTAATTTSLGGASSGICGPPTGLSVTAITSSSASFSWNAVLSATSYKLYLGASSGSETFYSAMADNPLTSGTAFSIPSGTTRYFYVTAVCGGVESSPSAEVAATTS